MLFASLVIDAPQWIGPAAALVGFITWLAWLGYRLPSVDRSTRWIGMFLKLTGISLLAVCLIEPLFSGIRPRPGANLFVVLVDDSRSMTVQTGSRVRGDRVSELLDEKSNWRTRLEQDFDVRHYRFDTQLRPADAQGSLALDGPASELYGALRTLGQRFTQRPIAGVLLVTDGNATDTPLDARQLESLGFPVYPIVDVDSAQVRDIRISQMGVSQTNFEAAPITVNATVQSQGMGTEEVTARVVNEQGTTIQEQTLVGHGGNPLEFQFRFQPSEPGLSFVRFQTFAKGRSHELSTQDPNVEFTWANNQRWIAIDRGGGPFHVLYVAGRPNWEYKFLRRALDEDHEIRLAGLLRIAKKQPKFSFQDRGGVSNRNQLFQGFEGKDDEDVEAYDQTVFVRIGLDENELRDGFPKESEALFPYHAVILDDLEAKFFTADQLLLLRRFVSQRGGGVLMLGGQESFVGGGYDDTPLGEMLPVYLNRPLDRVDNWQWSLTREGWLQPWTRLRPTEVAEMARLKEVCPLKVLNGVGGLKPGASLLATVQGTQGSPLPALATQRFGKGRTAALLVGDLWKWQTTQQDPKQRDLQQLWRQMIRWMVADVPQRVQVELRRDEGTSGSTTIAIHVRDAEFLPHDNASIQVRITTPKHEEVRLTAEPSGREPGHYSVGFWGHDEGPYRAVVQVESAEGEELPSKTIGWTSELAADEFEQLSTNRDALSQLASGTGGELVPVDDMDQFVSSLPSRKIPITETWVFPLWHQSWVLALAILSLCGEWGLRRWRGLP